MAGGGLEQLLDVLPRAPQLSRRVPRRRRRRARRTPPELLKRGEGRGGGEAAAEEAVDDDEWVDQLLTDGPAME